MGQCKCGNTVPSGAKFCENCGASLQERRCKCGNPLSATARFCSACGSTQSAAGTQSALSPAASTTQENAAGGSLLSRPPWEEERVVAPTEPSRPFMAEAAPPPPVLGRWKVTMVEPGMKLNDAMRSPEAQMTEFSMGNETEYTLSPDHTLTTKGKVRMEFSGPMVYATIFSFQGTGKWRYSARTQRLEMETISQCHLDDFEFSSSGICDLGVEYQNDLEKQLKRQAMAQLARPTKANLAYQIEGGDDRHFDARDADDNLLRFERLG